MNHHSPSALGAHINIGCDDTAAGAAFVRRGQLLVDAVHRYHHRLQQVLLAEPESDRLRGCEDLPPGIAHRCNARDARAARMDAVDLVVVGPYFHHRFQIVLHESFVERRFGVLRRRK